MRNVYSNQNEEQNTKDAINCKSDQDNNVEINIAHIDMIKILSLKIVSTQWFNLNDNLRDSIDFNLYNLIIPNAINVEQDTTMRLSLEITYFY